MFGYYSVGLQLSIELVHPYSEGVACALMLWAAQVTGLIVTPLYRGVFERLGPRNANIFMIFLLCIGTLLSPMVSTDYRRRQAEMETRIANILTEPLTKIPEEPAWFPPKIMNFLEYTRSRQRIFEILRWLRGGTGYNVSIETGGLNHRIFLAELPGNSARSPSRFFENICKTA